MNFRYCIKGGLLAVCFIMAMKASSQTQTKPNVVWIITEDISPGFRCYGSVFVQNS